MSGRSTAIQSQAHHSSRWSRASRSSRTRLVLPLSTAVACSLSHELEGQSTLRGTVYTLLNQVADALGGQIAAVEIVPAPNGMAAGHLRICGPDSAMLMPVEIALGIGLAVVLGIPLCVDDRLVHEAPKLDRPANGEATPEKPTTAEPAAALEVRTPSAAPSADDGTRGLPRG